MSVISNITSCVAAILEDDAGANSSSSDANRQQQLEDDRQVRAVFEEGLRLKRKVKDLSRMLQDVEQQRFMDRQEYERILRDKDSKLENLSAAHVLDIQAIRDAQAIEFHDLLKQLLDCKTTLARKASDVEELTKMLQGVQNEGAKREAYFQTCLKDLCDAHEVEKFQLQSQLQEQNDSIVRCSEQIAVASDEEEIVQSMRGKLHVVEAVLSKERSDKVAIEAALIAARLAEEAATVEIRELQQTLNDEMVKSATQEAKLKELVASRALVETAVKSVREENERLNLLMRVNESANKISANNRVPFSQPSFPVYPPPPVPFSAAAAQTREDGWGGDFSSPATHPPMSPLRAAFPMTRLSAKERDSCPMSPQTSFSSGPFSVSLAPPPIVSSKVPKLNSRSQKRNPI